MRSTIRSRHIIPALMVALVAASCGGGDDSPPASPSVNVPFAQTDIRVGTGAEATAGRRITVHYTGWLYSTSAPENKGQQFDSSVGGSPYSLTLGAREVIPGWDQGIVGMRVGGQRRLVIPPSLGYGSRGSGPIPPNATLVFDIELLNVS
jgi:FKBP-type peptidyl-prolyl cis-trans isomerase FkpA